MNNKVSSYQGIKVNIITGFLGAGKTTLIRHLLMQVPDGENWAVLVNEFGEVGLDKDLLEADLKLDANMSLDNPALLGNIAIKQVAGGCLCCTTSAAFQVSLNALIKRHNPDRILIEPTGLGHPQNILKQLKSPFYQSVLQLESVLCLLDARNLHDARYFNHPNFIEQIAMADTLIASKTELYQERDWLAFNAYITRVNPAKQRIEKIKQGRLALTCLDLESETLNSAQIESRSSEPYLPDNQKTLNDLLEPTDKNNAPEDINVAEDIKAVGFYSKTLGSETNLAWVFADDILFDHTKMVSWFEKIQSLDALLRIKAVLRLDKQQALLINASGLDHELRRVDKMSRSKIELILNDEKLTYDDLSEIKANVALLASS